MYRWRSLPPALLCGRGHKTRPLIAKHVLSRAREQAVTSPRHTEKIAGGTQKLQTELISEGGKSGEDPFAVRIMPAWCFRRYCEVFLLLP